MSKFKIGDKVRVRQWADMEKEFGLDCGGAINKDPYFTKSMKEYCGQVLTIDGFSISGWYTVEECIWKFCDEMFEPATVSKESTIVIYKKDNKVIALDKATGKTAEAICSPEDRFDFYVGADLAFERLLGRKPAPKAREEAPKYFTGEMVCVESHRPWYTKGKVYKVKNGVWVDDDGDRHDTKDRSVEEINARGTSKFIEVVK